jgi:hypothetical protein
VDGFNDQHSTIAVLNICGVHLGTDQKTASIGHNVAPTALNLLGRIPRVAALPRPRTGSTTRPTALGGLGRLTVDDPCRRARFAARRFARLQQQCKIDLLKQAVVSPIVEITLYGGKRWKVLRQHAPLTAGSRNIQDGIQHSSQLSLARSAQTLSCRHMPRNQRPFAIRQIACVALSLSLILPPSDRSTSCASVIASAQPSCHN